MDSILQPDKDLYSYKYKHFEVCTCSPEMCIFICVPNLRPRAPHKSPCNQQVSSLSDFSASLTFLPRTKNITQELSNYTIQFEETPRISTKWKHNAKRKKEKKLVVQQPPERVWIILGIRLVGWEPRHFLSDLIVFALFSFVGAWLKRAQTSSKTDPWGACKLNLWHLRMASKSRRQLGEMVTLVLIHGMFLSVLVLLHRHSTLACSTI